jgi:hypothetical protein
MNNFLSDLKWHLWQKLDFWDRFFAIIVTIIVVFLIVFSVITIIYPEVIK